MYYIVTDSIMVMWRVKCSIFPIGLSMPIKHCADRLTVDISLRNSLALDECFVFTVKFGPNKCVTEKRNL